MFVSLVTARAAARTGGMQMRMSGCGIAAIVALVLVSATPAFAQFDLTGSWGARDQKTGLNRIAVDYTGHPLNEDGRTWALTYSAAQLSAVERQCHGWPYFYLAIGPFGMKIWSDVELVRGETISYTIGAWEDRAPTTIWMDGRPHPGPSAPHDRAGFTTGKWEGNTLVTTTTHIKSGLLGRNGIPNSDHVVVTTRFTRHDSLLSVIEIIDDPIYLAEPMIATKMYELSAAASSPIGPPCVPAYEGNAGDGKVPHFLPETNPYVDELTKEFHVPREATLGFPETLYPEYRKKIKDTYVRPGKVGGSR